MMHYTLDTISVFPLTNLFWKWGWRFIWWDMYLKDECGLPVETVKALWIGSTFTVYFTTSNLCAEEFIENLAREKGLPPLLLATDATHHIWSFEVK